MPVGLFPCIQTRRPRRESGSRMPDDQFSILFCLEHPHMTARTAPELRFSHPWLLQTLDAPEYIGLETGKMPFPCSSLWHWLRTMLVHEHLDVAICSMHPDAVVCEIILTFRSFTDTTHWSVLLSVRTTRSHPIRTCSGPCKVHPLAEAQPPNRLAKHSWALHHMMHPEKCPHMLVLKVRHLSETIGLDFWARQATQLSTPRIHQF